MEDYQNGQKVTLEEEKEDGNYRSLKARRQSEAFRDRTRDSSQMPNKTPPDSIVSLLNRMQMPVTLKNWLAYTYPDDPPDNWWQESEVPQELEQELEAYLNGGEKDGPQPEPPTNQKEDPAKSQAQAQEELPPMTEKEAQLRIKAFLQKRSNSVKEA